MTDQPLSADDLERARDGAYFGEPCSHCGAKPQLLSIDDLPHLFHADDCRFAAHIRQLIDSGEISLNTETKG